MTENQTFYVAMATLITTTIISALTAVLTFMKAQQVAKNVSEVAGKVDVIHTATNSMKDELVQAVASAEFARGTLPGEIAPPAATTPIPPTNGGQALTPPL